MSNLLEDQSPEVRKIIKEVVKFEKSTKGVNAGSKSDIK